MLENIGFKTRALGSSPPKYLENPNSLRLLNALNKEVRPFFLSDNSILSYPSVPSLSDYSIWRS